MKTFVTAVLAASFAFGVVAPAIAAPICLDTIRIDHTSIPDAKHIVFHMRDGTAWSNTLKNRCPGLRFHGFAYAPFASRDVCENLQSVEVLETHEVCLLGKFEKQAPKTAM